MRRTTVSFVLAMIACAGCNTISGVGRDLNLVGKVVTKTASDASHAKGAACTPDNSRVPPRTCPPTSRTRYVAANPAAKPTATATAVKTSAPANAPGVQPAQTSAAMPAQTTKKDGTHWYDWPGASLR